MSSKEFFQIFLDLKNWNVHLNLLFFFICCTYLFLLKPIVPGWQKMCFVFSMMVYYVAMGSPIVLLAHELFSIHMLQMSLLYFVVPPLLLLGLPTYLLRLLFKWNWMGNGFSLFVKPLTSLFLFNGLISLYHIPVIFDAIMSRGIYHIISHIILFVAALLMWWPILAPIPEINLLKPLHRIALIFGNGILLTPACAIITFTDKVLYTLYSKMSELVPVISPLHDQQLGGVIMKITQEVVYITAICIVFFSWVRVAHKQERQEIMKWKEERRRRGDII